MSVSKAVGDYGEEIATQFLQEQGMEVVDRNWRCRYGELDLVARDETGVLVFVEVKTRRSVRYGSPTEAVVPSKAARLRRLACLWLDAHRLELPACRAVRIDVIGILLRRRGAPVVSHLQAVA